MKTLFNSLRTDTYDPNTTSVYAWLPDIDTLTLGDSQVLTNRTKPGWALTDAELSVEAQAPQGPSGHFLYQSGLCSMNGVSLDFEKKSHKMNELLFFDFAVTDSCNLACNYCFAHSSNTSGNATPEIAEIFIDRIMEHRERTGSSSKYCIDFSGGEPLLNFNTVRHAVTYAESRYGSSLNAAFTIQSNLTIMTDEIAEFVKDYNINLGISMDGYKEVHDKARPFKNGTGSHDAVMENIRLVADHKLNAGGAIAVITGDNINKMKEIAYDFYRKGFTGMAFSPCSSLGRGTDVKLPPNYYQDFACGLFAVLNDVITPIYQQTGTIFMEENLTRIFRSIVSSYRMFMCERTPCGAARNAVVVKPNGDVYPCHLFNADGGFLMGNLADRCFDELLDAPVVQDLKSRSLQRIDDCSTCPIVNLCQSPCSINSFIYHGDFTSKSAECVFHKEKYTKAFQGFAEDRFDLNTIAALIGDGKTSLPIAWVAPTLNK